MQRCSGERNGADRHEVAEQWYFNIVGACGECAVAKAIGRYWPAAINQRKGEPDIPPNIQVRTLAKPYYDLVVRKDDGNDFLYVLCLGEPPHFTVKGYIRGADAKRPEWFKDRGGRNKPCWWVPQANLLAPEGLMLTASSTALEGEHLPRLSRFQFDRPPKCGRCRRDMPVEVCDDGQTYQCHHCGAVQWFEITADNYCTIHPGFRVPPERRIERR